jgi:hypothetical protein
VLNVAIARVLFMTRSQIWPLMVIPALAVVLLRSSPRTPGGQPPPSPCCW